MTNTFQKKLYENGYLIVKNILNYRRDLKPVLNDMEFVMDLSLIHISEPTRLGMISYAVFCLKKKNKEN